MGRARRRARLAQQSGGRRAGSSGAPTAAAPEPAAGPRAGSTPSGPTPSGSARRAPYGQGPDDGERRLHDPQWRRAERRRIARLNRLPDPFRSWGDRSRAHAIVVAVLQMVLVVAVTLPLLRLTTGDWLPRYAAVVALALALATQAVCRSVNRRADERASGSRPAGP